MASTTADECLRPQPTSDRLTLHRYHEFISKIYKYKEKIWKLTGKQRYLFPCILMSTCLLVFVNLKKLYCTEEKFKGYRTTLPHVDWNLFDKTFLLFFYFDAIFYSELVVLCQIFSLLLQAAAGRRNCKVFLKFVGISKSVSIIYQIDFYKTKHFSTKYQTILYSSGRKTMTFMLM